MNFFNKYCWIVINVLIAFTIIGCMSEYDPITENDELIFKRSFEISVPPYYYINNELDTTYIHGDSSYYMNIPDTVTSTPVLKWNPVNLELNMTAIFKDPIIVANNSIINTNDIIWIWHSGFNSGENGYVQYNEGKSLVDGDINDTISPVPLFLDSTYYWGSWSWNLEGIRIWYSSRQLSLIIKE